MTATTTERNTPYKDPFILAVALAAGVSVLAGTIAVANADGFGEMATLADDLTYLGRFEESVDNSAGDDGEKTALVRRKKAFCWANHGADAVTQASLGKPCYIVDNQTVAKTSGTGTRSVAGIVLAIDSEGVWVE